MRITRSAAVLALAVALLTVTPATAARPAWSVAWAASMHHPIPANPYLPPDWSEEGFAQESLRQVVRITDGGPAVRIRLSNRFGTGPLRVTGATIGRAADGGAVRPGTLRPLTFHGRTATTVPAGAELASDGVPMRVSAHDRLTVTLYFAAATGPATFHEGGLTTTYRAAGDHRFDEAAFAGETSPSWFFLTGVDVVGRGAVVAFGDSITDGSGTTSGADHRYPDRLGAANAGINGNKLLGDSTCFGENGVDRFRRDALGQPGVRTVVVLVGINDIGGAGYPDFGCGSSPVVSAADLIAGHREIVRAAHTRGVRVVAATLPPIATSFYDTPANEDTRTAVNRWLRTSHAYDCVVDLDRVLADHGTLRPVYDSGDHLHPNDAGAAAIAAAVDRTCL